jgi:cyclin K
LKDRLTQFESVVLRSLSFELDLDLPYTYMLNYAHCLRLDEGVTQFAFNILNDSFLLPICLQYKSNEIACASIFLGIVNFIDNLATRLLDVKLEQIKGIHWFEVFGTKKELLESLVNDLLTLYE